MINAIAIDDEPLALVVIREFCSLHGDLKLLKTFTNTIEAAKYLHDFPVDLIFLDIQMPQNGLDFYRTHGNGRMVIFTTAFSEYAVEGFNVDAIDYLLKPFARERFDQAVDRAREYVQLSERSGSRSPAIFVRSEYRLIKIDTAQIDYIETMDDYLKIHAGGDKPVITKMNMKKVMEMLDPKEFIRIHRSYLVQLRKIVSVRGRNVEVAGVKLPIGDKYEADFRNRFLQP